MKFRAKPKEQEIVEAVQLKVALYGNGVIATSVVAKADDWIVVTPNDSIVLSDAAFRAAYEPLEGVDTSPVPLTIKPMCTPFCKCVACAAARMRWEKAMRHAPGTTVERVAFNTDSTPGTTPWCPACERPVGTVRS